MVLVAVLGGQVNAGTDTILAGGGDIATSGTGKALKTANVVKGILANNPNASALTLGDMAYPDGSASDFKNKYNPTWGQFKSRTYPVLGNHEYYTNNAGPAKSYFSSGAKHDLSPTYYAVSLNPTLKLIVLDSSPTETSKAHGGPSCDTQQQFEIQELRSATAAGQDTVLAWHHPRWTNGSSHQSDSTGCPRLFFDAAVDNGGDVVLNGHSHNYERFGPMGKNGPGEGPFEIVAGTGGASFDGFISGGVPYQKRFQANGALELHQDTDGSGFTYKFDAVGGSVLDSGVIQSR